MVGTDDGCVKNDVSEAPGTLPEEILKFFDQCDLGVVNFIKGLFCYQLLGKDISSIWRKGSWVLIILSADTPLFLGPT